MRVGNQIITKYYVLSIVQTRWRMNTTGDPLLGNTYELKNLIFDLHSNPAVLYMPLLHNHNDNDKNKCDPASQNQQKVA